MRKAFALTIILFASIITVFSQDIITLKSGEELRAHILHLDPEAVIFIPENNPDTVFLHRDEIMKLKYKSGILVYLSENNLPALSDSVMVDSMYLLGERDAARYYQGYKAAGTGTLVTSLFIPLGLIPAIACSNTKPALQKLGYRDHKLIQNPNYFAGYTDKAFEIKKKKVWKNFAIGTGTTLSYYVIMFLFVSAAIY
jgi:hypothetical protein